jgi:hypothetical protein
MFGAGFYTSRQRDAKTLARSTDSHLLEEKQIVDKGELRLFVQLRWLPIHHVRIALERILR